VSACAADSAAEDGEDGAVGADVASVTAAGDRRDPGGVAPSSERNAGTASVWGRQIVLHISDRDNGGWASIDNGDAGDEVWLDRSFDGGVGWDGRVGNTKVPNGRRGWRTMMYSVDDPGKFLVGALRACGKAGNRSEIACTPWFRTNANAANRLDAAATALMQLYNHDKGLWRTIGWWNSANALTTMLDYQKKTGSNAYRYVIARTFDKNSRAQDGDFTNEYMDDTAWWGLAWVRAFDVTGEQRYLDMAKKDADYLWSFKDEKCGGGVWWRNDKTYKNAITNELFIKLAASIHNRTPGDTTYLDRANQIWRWFKASGMINNERLINDGLDLATCKNNGQAVWSYNQGVILGGLVELNKATGDASLLTFARQLADASTTNGGLNPNGVLREGCESSADKCGVDGPSFKGVFARNLGELDRALPDHPYSAYLDRQANAMALHRTSLDQYGVHWSAGIDKVDAARQHSAVDLLVASD
jgi:predicted alpha-1,6-mannanase (GH76 family)